MTSHFCLLIICLNHGFLGLTRIAFSGSGKIFSVVKNIIYLTFFACSKESNKEKAPFARPRKTGFPCNRYFAVGVTNSSRFIGTQTCAAYRSIKKPIPSARSRWGPDFPWFPLGTFICPLTMGENNYFSII